MCDHDDDKVHETSLYTTSVCTGSLLLAAAGLLNGLEATTHWNAFDLLASLGAKPVKARVVQQVFLWDETLTLNAEVIWDKTENLSLIF